KCGDCGHLDPPSHCDDRSTLAYAIRVQQRPVVSYCVYRNANYRSEITSPLRSAATISPAWRPDRRSTAPFWLVSTIAPAPAPIATPAPAAPYTPLTSDGLPMLLTVPIKSVAAPPNLKP